MEHQEKLNTCFPTAEITVPHTCWFITIILSLCRTYMTKNSVYIKLPNLFLPGTEFSSLNQYRTCFMSNQIDTSHFYYDRVRDELLMHNCMLKYSLHLLWQIPIIFVF